MIKFNMYIYELIWLHFSQLMQHTVDDFGQF